MALLIGMVHTLLTDGTRFDSWHLEIPISNIQEEILFPVSLLDLNHG